MQSKCILTIFFFIFILNLCLITAVEEERFHDFVEFCKRKWTVLIVGYVPIIYCVWSKCINEPKPYTNIYCWVIWLISNCYTSTRTFLRTALHVCCPLTGPLAQCVCRYVNHFTLNIHRYAISASRMSTMRANLSARKIPVWRNERVSMQCIHKFPPKSISACKIFKWFSKWYLKLNWPQLRLNEERDYAWSLKTRYHIKRLINIHIFLLLMPLFCSR